MLENNQLTYQGMEPEAQPGFRLVDFVRVLFKRWPVILSFFLATVGTVILTLLLFHSPMYHTEAKLMLEIGKEHIFDPTLLTSDAGRPIIRYNAHQQTAFAGEILQGHYLLDRAVRKIGHDNIYPAGKLMGNVGAGDQEIGIEKAIKLLQEEIVVSSVPDSSLLNIGFEHEDPELAAEVVNLLVSLFIGRHLAIRKDDKKRDFYEEQAVLLEEKLQVNEKLLQATKTRYGVLSSIPEEMQILVEQRLKLEAARSDTFIQMSEVKERIVLLKTQIGNTPRNAQAITALNSRLLELQQSESEFLSNFDSKSRVVRNVREEIGTVKAKIKTLGEGKRYGNAPSTNGSLYQRLQEEILKQEVEVSALKATGDAQQTQLDQYRNKISSLGSIEMRMERQEEQIKIDQRNYKIFLSKFEQASISNAMDEEGITSIRVVEPAYVANRPIEGKRRLTVLASMIFGLIGGVGLAYLLELLGPTMDTKKDVERYLGVPVLAIVPEALLPDSSGQ